MDPFCFFENCIFCGKDLPKKKERGTKGEHIFPENIEGFWKSLDICVECKEYFGDKIDSIPLKNPEIIAAMKKLELDKKKTFGQGLKYIASSDLAEHDEKIDLYDKKGTMHVSAKEVSPDKFNCDENDTHIVGLEYIKKYRSPFLDENEIKEEFAKLLQNYNSLDSGEVVRSEKLKVWMKKGKLKDFKVNEESIASATPLIAKILIFVIHYFLPLDIPILKNYFNILNHARNGQELEDYLVIWNPEPKLEYSKFHRITIEFLKNAVLVDISLFRYANWTTLLLCTENHTSHIQETKEETFEMNKIMLVFDFEMLENKKLHFYYKIKDEDKWYELDINNDNIFNPDLK